MAKLGITPNSNATWTLGTRAKAPGGAAPSQPSDDVSPTPGGDVQVTPVGTPFKPVNTTKPSGALGGAPGEGQRSSRGLDALRGR
jgi:hypothetical protein